MWEFLAGIIIGLLAIHLVYILYFHWILLPHLERRIRQMKEWVEREILPLGALEKMKIPLSAPEDLRNARANRNTDWSTQNLDNFVSHFEGFMSGRGGGKSV